MTLSPVQLRLSDSDPGPYQTLLEQLKSYDDVSLCDARTVASMPWARAFQLMRSDELDFEEMRRCVNETSEPIIYYEPNPTSTRITDSFRAGALALVGYPFEVGEMLPLLWPQSDEAVSHEEAIRFALQCRGCISRLSRRQRDVLKSLVEGRSNKEVASSLAISPRTVEVHRAALMERTGAKSVSDLIKLAIVSGLFDDTLTQWRKSYNFS